MSTLIFYFLAHTSAFFITKCIIFIFAFCFLLYSICCTLREDLLVEVAKIANSGNFDYLLIESTGVVCENSFVYCES